MNYKKTCSCCGVTSTAYVHALNEGLIQALAKLWQKKDVVKLSDLGLTINQYNNFQKLRYFGLVHRTSDGYYVTQKGKSFLLGIIRIQSRVATMNNVVLGSDHEAWDTDEKGFEYKYVYDYVDQKFSYKDEYEKEQTFIGNKLF